MVDAVEFVRAVRANRGVLTKLYRRRGTWLAEVVRLATSGALTAVFYASHQVETPLAAVTIGAAAPIIVDRMLKQSRPRG